MYACASIGTCMDRQTRSRYGYGLWYGLEIDDVLAYARSYKYVCTICTVCTCVHVPHVEDSAPLKGSEVDGRLCGGIGLVWEKGFERSWSVGDVGFV